MRETIIDNDCCSLWYYPDKQIIHHRFKKFVYGSMFRTLMTRGAELLEQTDCKKWLSDARKNLLLHPDDRAWADVNWTPRVLAAGWQYWAIVLPETTVGKLNIRRRVQEYQDMGIETRIFSDPDDALAWLESL